MIKKETLPIKNMQDTAKKYLEGRIIALNVILKNVKG